MTQVVDPTEETFPFPKPHLKKPSQYKESVDAGILYLLCFPEGNIYGGHHYLGWTTNDETFSKRMEYHRKTKGGEFFVAKVWPGSREQEAAYKRQKNNPRFCPICKGAKNGN